MRWTWWHFAALVTLSVALTAFSFALDWPFGGFFLLLPLIFPPLRFAGKAKEQQPRQCPACGFTTLEDWFDYCPRDGTRLTRGPNV